MKSIPVTTMRRYPQYLRVLRGMHHRGVKRVMSRDIAREMDIEPTTVRRDFSYLGKLGRQGYGYDVESLIPLFYNELSNGQNENCVLFGVGNMGKALLKYNSFEDKVGKIVCAFDMDVRKVGIEEGVPVYHISELNTKFPRDVKIVILAVPGEFVQEIADKLFYLGVKAFINFSDGDIKHRRRIIVQKIDLVSMIQEVIYRFKQEY